jgi:uncharacterized protein (DUF1697 family)
MAMARYVALLRGINVGGKNLIKMADLQACLEEDGLEDVATYIQSGNVVFGSAGSSLTELTGRIEELLSTTFGYEASVVLRSRQQMRATLDRAPAGFGGDPARYRYDAIFLKAPLTARTAMRSVLTKEGVDQADVGPGVLYFSRLTSRASQSRLGKIVGTPVYRNMTIRNWNTTTKLARMLEGDE